MFFPKDAEDVEDENDIIISKDEPIEYSGNKNIVIQRGISKEDYNEIYEFIRDQNQMSSGNFTLLPTTELDKFVKMDSLMLLMRSKNSSKLIGSIFSMLFPIRCKLFQNNDEIVTHGCTTFLNVHSKLRNHGMCMALIRELSRYGYEKNLYCSYSLTSFPLSPKSIPISSWYCPIDLAKSIALGFTYPNWNNPAEFMKNRMLYKIKKVKKHSINRVSDSNIEKALSFYAKINEGRKFVYAPNSEEFRKFILQYPTFLIELEKKPVGIFAISSVYCRMEMDGILALPLIFNSLEEHAKDVMKCLLSVAKERDYDTLYSHCVGDITSDLLKSVNAIQTKEKTYFSLYNNSMKLSPEDLYVPLF